LPEEKNSVSDIRRYLSTPDNPVSMEEFTVFWKSLSDEEKDEYKNTELPKE
jgi:hypothetical protein